MGIQKDRLIETVLLVTQTYVHTGGLDFFLQFYAQIFGLSKPMTE